MSKHTSRAHKFANKKKSSILPLHTITCNHTATSRTTMCWHHRWIWRPGSAISGMHAECLCAIAHSRHSSSSMLPSSSMADVVCGCCVWWLWQTSAQIHCVCTHITPNRMETQPRTIAHCHLMGAYCSLHALCLCLYNKSHRLICAWHDDWEHPNIRERGIQPEIIR